MFIGLSLVGDKALVLHIWGGFKVFRTEDVYIVGLNFRIYGFRSSVVRSQLNIRDLAIEFQVLVLRQAESTFVASFCKALTRPETMLPLHLNLTLSRKP